MSCRTKAENGETVNRPVKKNALSPSSSGKYKSNYHEISFHPQQMAIVRQKIANAVEM